MDAEFDGLLVAEDVADALPVAEALVLGLAAFGFEVGVWVGQPVAVAVVPFGAPMESVLAFGVTVESAVAVGVPLSLGLVDGLTLTLSLGLTTLLEGLLDGLDGLLAGLGGVDTGVALGLTRVLDFGLAEADVDGEHAVGFGLLRSTDEPPWLRPAPAPAPLLPGPPELGAPLAL